MVETELVSLGAFATSALSDIQLTPDNLKTFWGGGILPWAVNQLIETACYGEHNPLRHDHQACAEFFYSLPEERRLDEFYCLEAAEKCINCGHTWFGALSGKCPQCGEEYLPKTLQRWNWRYKVTQTIVTGADQHERSARTITIDIKFRLAEYVANSGISDQKTFPTIYEALDFKAKAIYSTLREMGLGGNASDASDAAGWVAFSIVGLSLLGLDAEEIADWSRQQQREFVPTLRQATLRYSKGQLVPDVQDILKESADFRDKLSAIRAELKGDSLPDQVIIFNTPQGRYMLSPINEGQLVRLRARNVPIQERSISWNELVVLWENQNKNSIPAPYCPV